MQESKSRWEKDEVLRKEQAATVRQKPVNTGWSPVLSAAFKESPRQRSSLMLSSALPSPEKIALSAKKLADRTGLRVVHIISSASNYTNRGQLQGYTPESFAGKWGEQLNLPIKEAEDFLVDAGYLLRC